MVGEKREKVKDIFGKIGEKLFTPAASAADNDTNASPASNAPTGVPSSFKPAKKPSTKPSAKPSAKPDTTPDAEPGAGAKPAAKKSTNKEAKYADVPWSKLPLSARKAAKAIGFEQQSWDDKKWLDIDDKHWSDLTPEEQAECETLGWDAVSWDPKCENQVGLASGTKPAAEKSGGFTDKEAKYEDVPWSKLPLSARKAAKAIGFEQQSWDDNEWIDIDDYHWWDLTPEQQAECETLGWDAVSWDPKYEDQSWEDLPQHVQKAAEKMGWNQENWDEDWDTPTWDKEWEDFSKDEQRCLHVLGYYVHTW